MSVRNSAPACAKPHGAAGRDRAWFAVPAQVHAMREERPDVRPGRLITVVNTRLFLGHLINHDDQQDHYQDADHRPKPHPSTTHPSVCMVHQKAPLRCATTSLPSPRGPGPVNSTGLQNASLQRGQPPLHLSYARHPIHREVTHESKCAYPHHRRLPASAREWHIHCEHMQSLPTHHHPVYNLFGGRADLISGDLHPLH